MFAFLLITGETRLRWCLRAAHSISGGGLQVSQASFPSWAMEVESGLHVLVTDTGRRLTQLGPFTAADMGWSRGGEVERKATNSISL